MTNACAMSGCASSTISTSRGDTFAPCVLIISVKRPVKNR